MPVAAGCKHAQGSATRLARLIPRAPAHSRPGLLPMGSAALCRQQALLHLTKWSLWCAASCLQSQAQTQGATQGHHALAHTRYLLNSTLSSVRLYARLRSLQCFSRALTLAPKQQGGIKTETVVTSHRLSPPMSSCSALSYVRCCVLYSTESLLY